jgi:L,D-transpeptidase ErfK/SrfK
MMMKNTRDLPFVGLLTKPAFQVKFIRNKTLSLLSAMLLFSPILHAQTYLLPTPLNDVIGQQSIGFIKPEEDIKQLAREKDIGYYEVIQANPTINPDMTYPWQTLTIPTRYILPDAEKKGIVINLAELRLYYYPDNSPEVITYPVAIGMLGSETPTGHFSIIEKLDHPRWFVPKSILKEMAKQGIYLPDIIEAGPENPLGEYGLRLSARTYLLHGTNVPPTVGRRASAGCLHLYPENIKQLYDAVEVGTPVTIIDQPFKAGWMGNTLYFQAVEPLREDRMQWLGNYKPIYTRVIQEAIKKTDQPVDIDWKKVQAMLQEPDGIARPIGQIRQTQ